jgi:ubiquinone/menaquinone biosynthesis C-methylase UbiE
MRGIRATVEGMADEVHTRAASFDATAADYERGRPGWPAAALDALADRLGLDAGSTVLDLAAGTGKLTRELVPRFASVVAVEPLDGMRAVLADVVPGARVLAGTAEAIPLEDASVDAVSIAEAFHWFDAEAAVAEMARVLRPGGGVAVLYNRRDIAAEREAWQREMHMVFEAHRLPPDAVDPHDAEPWKAALAARIAEPHDEAFGHTHLLDRDGLLAQYGSFSVIGGLAPARREAALAAFAEVLDRHRVRRAEIAYRTVLTTARPT